MKLYIWKGFEEDDFVGAVSVMAESLDKAREIALESYAKDYEGDYIKEATDFLADEPTEEYDIPAASWF